MFLSVSLKKKVMTTAHRPTFNPALGGNQLSDRASISGGKGLVRASEQYSSKDQTSHTKLKYRTNLQKLPKPKEANSDIEPRPINDNLIMEQLKMLSRKIQFEENCYIDEYFGLSTQLRKINHEIGALVYELRRTNQVSGGQSEVSYDEILRRAEDLEQRLINMVNQSHQLKICFHPRISDSLSPEEKHEYSLCNSAYEYTALIVLRRRIRGLPGSSYDVQMVVGQVLDLVSQMKPSQGLSPWLLISSALFVAGSEAIGSDRLRVRELLGTLRDTIRITKYQRTITILENYWGCSNNEGHSNFELMLGRSEDHLRLFLIYEY